MVIDWRLRHLAGVVKSETSRGARGKEVYNYQFNIVCDLVERLSGVDNVSAS